MNQTLKPLPSQMIYALDIGTRNVVGVVGRNLDSGYEVVAHYKMSHPDRAMFDGQIHDIEKVTQVVTKVTRALEEKTGYQLERVAIAAAGRALKTQRVEVAKAIDPTIEIDKATVDAIEIEAIQLAQTQLERTDRSMASKYYCVGYSVVNYYLDDAMILNPLEHRGSVLSMHVIATFLPHSVVDSLYTVVDKMGLEVMNLTLEPIAAIQVAIPQKFRLLNLALVDVGAGTSDIALTKEGAVFSYAMVDVAGDEITEALANQYLLDFQSAENLKIKLNQQASVAFSDIVGMPYELTSQEVVEGLEKDIDALASKIAARIIEANDGKPSAVFMIGGGCQVPTMGSLLAKHLGLPPERVVIKGAEHIEHIHYLETPFTGPEYITPLGIGYTALKDKEQDFLHIHVNDTPIRLFNSKKLTVSDALVLVGFSARKLLPERGKPLHYSLNGQEKKVMGGYGEPSHVYVNGEPAHLDTPLKNKDSIVIDPAVKGDDARAKLIDLLDIDHKIYLEDEVINLYKDVTVNGNAVGLDYVMKEDDAVRFTPILTVEDLIAWKRLGNVHVHVNGRLVQPTTKLRHGDYVTIKHERIVQAPVANKAAPRAYETRSPQLEDTALKPLRPAEKRVLDLTVNGQHLTITTPKDEFVFVDIFDHYAFDLTKPKGLIDLKLNGHRARYTDVLKSGDQLTIGWKQ